MNVKEKTVLTEGTPVDRDEKNHADALEERRRILDIDTFLHRGLQNLDLQVHLFRRRVSVDSVRHIFRLRDFTFCNQDTS